MLEECWLRSMLWFYPSKVLSRKEKHDSKLACTNNPKPFKSNLNKLWETFGMLPTCVLSRRKKLFPDVIVFILVLNKAGGTYSI